MGKRPEPFGKPVMRLEDVAALAAEEKEAGDPSFGCSDEWKEQQGLEGGEQDPVSFCSMLCSATKGCKFFWVSTDSSSKF